jgi:hypothetical protein
MADNVTLNPGTNGPVCATDDVGGEHYQKLKVVNGQADVAQMGWTPHRLVSAATTNATSVKASAGQIGFIFAINLNAAIRYLKLYNKASAPTVGTDTPIATLPIPASSTGAGFMLTIPSGVNFSTGIAYATTTGVADSDTAAVAANEILLFLGYC